MAVIKKMKNAIASFDIYSTGVSMSFNRSTAFKTLYGGLFSIFLIIVMAAISFQSLRKLINKEIKSTMISRTYENVFNNPKEHEFMKNGPNFIFEYFSQNLPYNDNGDIPPGLFSFKLEKQFQIGIDYGMVYGTEDIPMTKWDMTSILSKFGEKVKINSHTFCFADNNVITYGSRGTNYSKVFARFEKCDPNLQWWYPDDTKLEHLVTAEFRLNVVNKYYDFSDIKNPLKEYVQDTDYLSLDLSYYNKMQIFLRENRVVQYDSIWPWADPKEYIFYSVSDTKINFSSAIEENSLVLGEFEIAMDNQIGKLYDINLHRHLREESIHNTWHIQWHWRDFRNVPCYWNYSGGHIQ
jgi:hypothetical protein